MNFPHREQNGILKHLYKKKREYYNDTSIFSYNASGYHKQGNHLPQHALDFNDNNYWTDNDNPNSNNENFVSFCFKKGFAVIKGYEIKASSLTTLPNEWTLSASNDNEKWSFNKTTSHAMEKNEVFYVDWYFGPFRCYRFDFLNNTLNGRRASDVKQIEIFGMFYPNDFLFCKTNKRKYASFDNSILLLSCFLLK